jgi:alpha-L-arabinofuranosidase
MKSVICCTLILFGCLAWSNSYSKPLSVTVDTVDVDDTGAPIHPFVYGQFIEHLGRCIYGGIWAEMLEDRKFYFPITSNYNPYGDASGDDYPVVSASPWEVVGSADGGGLTIGIVNPTDETVDVQIDFKNAMLSGIGDHYYITGDGRGARNRSGETREVDIALDRGVNVSKFYSAPSLSSNIFIVSFK